MTEKEIRTLLGIDDKVDLNATIVTMSETVKGAAELRKTLKLKEGEEVTKLFTDVTARAEKAEVELAELKEKSGVKDESTDGKILVDEAEFSTMKTQLKDGTKALERVELMEAEKEVDAELASGKTRIAPKQREWAIKYRMDNPEGFKAYLESAPVVVSTEIKGSGSNVDLSDNPRAVLNAAVEAKVVESNGKMSYDAASAAVRAEKPDLYTAAFSDKVSKE